jgi:hypothetical protein
VKTPSEERKTKQNRERVNTDARGLLMEGETKMDFTMFSIYFVWQHLAIGVHSNWLY